MATYDWEFGAAGSGLYFDIVYDTNTAKFAVTSHEGSFDLNALWWSDGVADGSSPTLSKADSSLNMNGAVIVWDDSGGSTSQKIDWDGLAILSNPGLGTDGTNKSTFISAGETALFSVGGFDPTDAAMLGVRATSVNGGGSIKYADGQAEVTPDQPDGHFPDNLPISQVDFYFHTGTGNTNDDWFVVKFDNNAPASNNLDVWFNDAVGFVHGETGISADSVQGVVINGDWYNVTDGPEPDMAPVTTPLATDAHYDIVGADPFEAHIHVG